VITRKNGGTGVTPTTYSINAKTAQGVVAGAAATNGVVSAAGNDLTGTFSLPAVSGQTEFVIAYNAANGINTAHTDKTVLCLDMDDGKISVNTCKKSSSASSVSPVFAAIAAFISAALLVW
jgi:hypothetical protein